MTSSCVWFGGGGSGAWVVGKLWSGVGTAPVSLVGVLSLGVLPLGVLPLCGST